jgi:hypothetical protein
MSYKIKLSDITDIEISKLCIQTSPCIHTVIFTINNSKKYTINEISAIEIMYYLLKKKQYYKYSSHFNYLNKKFLTIIKNKTLYSYLNYYDMEDESIYTQHILNM